MTRPDNPLIDAHHPQPGDDNLAHDDGDDDGAHGDDDGDDVDPAGKRGGRGLIDADEPQQIDDWVKMTSPLTNHHEVCFESFPFLDSGDLVEGSKAGRRNSENSSNFMQDGFL